MAGDTLVTSVQSEDPRTTACALGLKHCEPPALHTSVPSLELLNLLYQSSRSHWLMAASLTQL